MQIYGSIWWVLVVGIYVNFGSKNGSKSGRVCDLHTLLLWKRLIQPIEYLVVWRGKGLSLKSAYPWQIWNPFNDNIVKRLVVGAFVVDYYLTTNDYHILSHFALFCVVCHIMQKLCDFWKVRKTLQNTANHGILGGKIIWLKFFSYATATFAVPRCQSSF